MFAFGLRLHVVHRLYSCRSIPSLSDWFMHSRRPMRCLLTPWRFETDRSKGKPTESVFCFSFLTNSKTIFGTVERCWKKVVECFYMFLLSLKSRGLFFEVHAICIRDFTPGLAQLFQCATHRISICQWAMIMEYCPGGDLQQVLLPETPSDQWPFTQILYGSVENEGTGTSL